MENLEFRQKQNQQSANRDEVIFKLSHPIGKLDVDQVIQSATALRQRCVRCDFQITLLVEEEEHATVVAAATNGLFTNILRLPAHTSLARALLFYPKLPFIVYLDKRVVSNHRFFPESIFDMLHREYDLIMPHSVAGGQLSSNVVGFINSASLRRVLALWDGRGPDTLSQTLDYYALPEVKTFALSREWACPAQTTFWSEGNQIGNEFKHLTANACKSYQQETE